MQNNLILSDKEISENEKSKNIIADYKDEIKKNKKDKVTEENLNFFMIAFFALFLKIKSFFIKGKKQVKEGEQKKEIFKNNINEEKQKNINKNENIVENKLEKKQEQQIFNSVDKKVDSKILEESIKEKKEVGLDENKKFDKYKNKENLNNNMFNAPIIKTNLIKNEIVDYFDIKKGLKLMLKHILFFSYFFVFICGGLLLWKYQNMKFEEEVYSQIDQLSQKVLLKKEKIKDIKNKQAKIQIVSNLIDNHIFWTNFFEFLENNLLSSVYFDSEFSGNLSNKYIFSAMTNNIDAVTAQVELLKKNENIIDVFVEKTVYEKIDEDEKEMINFKIEIIFDEKILKKNLSYYN